jgi:hypothetical protein
MTVRIEGVRGSNPLSSTFRPVILGPLAPPRRAGTTLDPHLTPTRNDVWGRKSPENGGSCVLASCSHQTLMGGVVRIHTHGCLDRTPRTPNRAPPAPHAGKDLKVFGSAFWAMPSRCIERWRSRLLSDPDRHVRDATGRVPIERALRGPARKKQVLTTVFCAQDMLLRATQIAGSRSRLACFWPM